LKSVVSRKHPLVSLRMSVSNVETSIQVARTYQFHLGLGLKWAAIHETFSGTDTMKKSDIDWSEDRIKRVLIIVKDRDIDAKGVTGKK
jgi:hypothetical protein